MKSLDLLPCGVVDTIEGSMLAAGIASPIGAFVPMVDMAAISGIWATMFYKIGEYHNVSFTKTECAKIVTACSSAVMAYVAGSKFLNWALNLIPCVGQLGAATGNTLLNVFYTKSLGVGFHKMLETEDINGRTIAEIGKLVVRYCVMIPSISDLKDCFNVVK